MIHVEKQDQVKLQRGFVVEALRRLRPQDHLPVPSLQAFAVLFLVDLGAAKARSAAGYLRCAADYLATPEPNQSRDDAFEVSRWGIHTLNTSAPTPPAKGICSPCLVLGAA
jgi:hypothetical protein